MARIITLTNVSGAQRTYAGQTIADTATYTVQSNETDAFKLDTNLFSDVSTGAVLIGDGTQNFSDPIQGWEWLQGAVNEVTITQANAALGGKVSVHSSAKPEFDDAETFVVWTGAGDDPNATEGCGLGEGELLNFQMTVGGPSVVSKDVIWNQAEFGRVWIHEAYLKFTNGGNGDYITAYVMAKPSTILDAATVAFLEGDGQLPPGAVSLDLVLDQDEPTRVKPAPDGAGTGTHGFGATPVLVPHTFSKDGDWDYDGVNLIPNVAGTGGFTIHTVEKVAHKYVNKIPCYGTCATYFIMSSDETAQIRDGYFVRIECHNVSNQNWQASILMEIYREQTISHACLT